MRAQRASLSRSLSQHSGFDRAGEEQQQDERADEQAVADEDAGRVLAQVAQEVPDGGVADQTRDNRRDGEWDGAARGQAVDGLLQLKQAAGRDGGNRE